MTKPVSHAPIRGPDDFRAVFGVSRETAGRLATYADLLRQWQRTINLVAPSTLDAVWDRHLADSAQVLAIALEERPDIRQWVDMGSGAGFPGLVVAILLAERGLGRVTLIESDSRKAAFLAEVGRRTGVSVDIRTRRIENAATRINLPPAEIVSARALAPLVRLLELSSPYLAPPGVAVFLKGRGWEEEVRAAEVDWVFSVRAVPSRTEAEARVLVLRDIVRR